MRDNGCDAAALQRFNPTGGEGPTRDAITLIHQTSRGYPRAINNLAIAALLAAYATDKALVDESSARTAVAEHATE